MSDIACKHIILVSPVSRKSPWINFGFKKVKLERNADNSGREFWAWIFGVAWNPGKTRPKNSLSKFAIRIRWEIHRQFSYNSPGQNKKFTPNPLCIPSGPNYWGTFGQTFDIWSLLLFGNPVQRMSATKLRASLGLFCKNLEGDNIVPLLTYPPGRKNCEMKSESITLKTLTSLNKEVWPFFLSDNSIWSLPSVSSLSDYSIWRSWGLF